MSKSKSRLGWDISVNMKLKIGFSKVTYGGILEKHVFSIQPYDDKDVFNKRDEDIFNKIIKEKEKEKVFGSDKRLNMKYITNNGHSQISIVINDNNTEIKEAIKNYNAFMSKDIAEAAAETEEAAPETKEAANKLTAAAAKAKTDTTAVADAEAAKLNYAILLLNIVYKFDYNDINDINNVIKLFIDKKNEGKKDVDQYKYTDYQHIFTKENTNKLLIISSVDKETKFIDFMKIYSNDTPVTGGGAKKKAKITKKEIDLNKMTKRQMMSKYLFLEDMDDKKKSELIKIIINKTKKTKK